jgi:methionyl aminopeptidase
MRRAGQLAAAGLDLMVELARPGTTTAQLDRAAFAFAMDHGAYPAPLHYRGYPKSICTSINHVVCHGIPNDKPLVEGDIVNIDITYVLDGWHGDSSRMYAIGRIKPFAQRLIDVTHEALMRGIAAIRPGASTRDIGMAIQTYAEQQRCSVVEDFCGHGLGRLFHDEPNILHYGVSRKRRGRMWDGGGRETVPDIELKPGMFFTVEPMINLGGLEVKVSRKDGWTAVTADKSLSAQFEHTVGVTADGVEVFTYSPKGWHKPPYGAAA